MLQHCRVDKWHSGGCKICVHKEIWSLCIHSSKENNNFLFLFYAYYLQRKSWKASVVIMETAPTKSGPLWLTWFDFYPGNDQ